MGMFDNTANRQYNNAIPNLSPEDGIDILKCNKEECKYNDIEKHTCVFETCIFKQFPLSVPFHKELTTRCDICGSPITHIFDDCSNPLLMDNMCVICKNKLRELLL